MSIFRKVFRRNEAHAPKRLFVVIGDPSRSPFQKYKEPRYNTDPRRYRLQLLDHPVSDEQFDRDYKHKLRAFTDRADAVSCARHCNLDSVMCPVYDRVDNTWVYNKEETSRLAESVR